MNKCKKCEKQLTFDEVALYKRLCGKFSEEFFCIACLAEHFKVSEELLRDKIKQFRTDGCMLFIKDDGN